MSPTVTLNSLVVPGAPICYGILMPGADTPGGIPVVKVRDYNHSDIDVGQLLRAAPEVEAPFRRSRLQAGDILMSIRGTTGVVVVASAALEGANITQDTARIRVHDQDRNYVFQVLQAPVVQQQIRLQTIGQAVKGINIASVRKLQLPWPKAPTRELLARTMCDCDDQAKALQHQIALKRIFRRGIQQKLLRGQDRLAPFRERKWHTSRLGDHLNRIERRNATGIDLALTASGEYGLVDQRSYFNRKITGSDLRRYYLLKRGEFAYNRSAMKGYPYGAIKRLDEHEAGALSTLYLCFAIRDLGLDSDYLMHVFESGVLNRQLRPIVRIGARAHGLLNVNEEDFLSINIPVPELDEQRRIAGVLNLIDQELAETDQLRAKLELLKRGLLIKLLSDELEVQV